MTKVVIVGGGTSGWMCAAALARISPPGTDVTLIESDEIGIIGVGEATIPLLAEFNQFLGIDEHHMLSECSGTFKLGIEFIDWYQKGKSYFHPFGFFGKDMPQIPFHQLWLKLNKLAREGVISEGIGSDICDFNLCTVAAKLGRFSQPSGSANTIISTMRHAYHFDSAAYGKLLRRYAEKRQVTRIEGKVVDIHQNVASGDIQSVVLENGRVVKGDLFIDCSGFRALLIGKCLNSEFIDWSSYLPCDRAIAVQTKSDTNPQPITQAYAQDAGWRWKIPLQNRTGNGYVYCSKYLSQDEALASLIDNLQDEPLHEPRHLKFQTGHRRNFWQNNCVAIGLAGGFIEPLESTSIHLVQVGIQHLIELWPLRGGNGAEKTRYNQVMASEYQDIRDFIVLHYNATSRNDSAFWRYVRDMQIPQSLKDTMTLFQSSGEVDIKPDALFTPHSWVAVMLGQGIYPTQYNGVVDSIPQQALIHNMEGLRKSVRRTAEAMPTHKHYLNTNCVSSKQVMI